MASKTKITARTPRSQSSDLLAVFSMPGLEEIAAPLFPYSSSKSDAVALVGYLAARPATRSANALDMELSDPWMWDRIRTVAFEHGRLLPEKPPTFNKLHHLRRRIGDDIEPVLWAMQDWFMIEAFKVARLVGLADPATVGDLLRPVRSNTLYADGTWWEALSKLFVDPETGEVFGSRSELVHGPRVADVLTTTKHGKKLTGIPFVMAGVRGDLQLQRVVLGMRRFLSPGLIGKGGETVAAMDLISRVLEHSGGGLRWCVYDMAFRGTHLEQLARQGVVGIAAMTAAAETQEHLLLPDEGDGPQRYNNDGRKARIATGSMRSVTHRVGERWCDHMLSGVDGSLRMHHLAHAVRATDPVCPIRNLVFEPTRHEGRFDMIGTFEVPCPEASFTVKIELTGHVKGRSGSLTLNRVRPIHEYDPQFAAVHGWRQDVESLNATMKRAVPLDGQATSLRPAEFELDVLGSALWVNARCWDTHVSQVSFAAQEAERLRRKRDANRVQLAEPVGTTNAVSTS